MTVAFVGAAVYGTVAFAHSINDDLRGPAVASTRTGDVPAVPDPMRDAYATDAPRNGPPANSAVSATDSTGEVKLYQVRSTDHVVTVPVSVTNTGDTRALCTVTVSVTGEYAGVELDNAVSIDGAVLPRTATSTEVSCTGIGGAPLTDVSVLDVRKQRCPAT